MPPNHSFPPAEVDNSSVGAWADFPRTVASLSHCWSSVAAVKLAGIGGIANLVSSVADGGAGDGSAAGVAGAGTGLSLTFLAGAAGATCSADRFRPLAAAGGMPLMISPAGGDGGFGAALTSAGATTVRSSDSVSDGGS